MWSWQCHYIFIKIKIVLYFKRHIKILIEEMARFLRFALKQSLDEDTGSWECTDEKKLAVRC